jgi:thiol-disulfide isomerase/thioredoxin
MDPIVTDDKNKIDVTVYKINDETKLYTYTATWCGPCKRIKPIVIDIMSKNKYKMLSQEIIEKTVFKKTINEFVPFFVIERYVDTCYNEDGIEDDIYSTDIETDSIQTSDEHLFRNFLSKNGVNIMVLDDDF